MTMLSTLAVSPRLYDPPHLSLFTPLPEADDIADFDVNPRITTLRHRTVSPGGFETMEVGFYDPDRPGPGFLPSPLELRGLEHAVLEHGGALCCEGRVLTLDMPGGLVMGFTAKGYGFSDTGLGDGWYQPPADASVTALVLLKDVLTDCCPYITVSANPTWAEDSLITHSKLTYTGKMASEIIDMLSKESGGPTSGVDVTAPYDPLIYELRVLRWAQRLAPKRIEDSPPGTFGPTYYLDFEPGAVQWKPDFSQFYNAVTVFYTVPGGTVKSSVTKTDQQSQKRYGLIRSIAIEGGERSTEQATAYAQTYLALHTRPQVSCTVTRDQGRGLSMARGGEQLPMNVRAGEWLQVGDQEPVYILNTDFDWFSESLSITAGWYPPGYWADLAVLQQVTRAAQAYVNVNTGAPQ